MTSHFKKEKNMLEELLKRKKKLDHEIYLMSFLERWRPEQRRELEQYQIELKNVEYQITQLTKKENT